SGLLTLTFVIFAWVFFRADTPKDAIYILGSLFKIRESHVLMESLAISTAPAALLIYAIYSLIMCLPKYARTIPGRQIGQQITDRLSTPARAVCYAAIALAVVGFAPTQPSPFIYFQF